MKIAIIGASGFVGAATSRAAIACGYEVVSVRAPRLLTTSRGTGGLTSAATELDGDIVDSLAAELGTVDAVINAAGVAQPKARMTDDLIGANSLLPGLVVLASKRAGVRRIVHISTAAVHGDAKTLDPSANTQPNSPYGFSKVWGERAAVNSSQGGGPEVVVYRPTSVHGDGRRTTEQVRRLARSPLSSVAGSGEAPTPQVMVESVGQLAVQLAVQRDVPTLPVIHPWEGWTTASFLEYMGNGKRPLHIPVSIASKALTLTQLIGRINSGGYATARRLELLWFGQRQPGSFKNDVIHPKILIATTVDASLGLLAGFPQLLASQGWEVHLASSGGPLLAQYSNADEISTHTISMARDPSLFRDIYSLAQWIRLLRRLDPHITYLGTPKASFLGSLAARLVRVPERVYLVRGLRLETVSGIKRQILKLSEKVTMRCSTSVISVSASLSERIRVVTGYNARVLGYGTSNGIDLSKYRRRFDASERLRKRRQLGIPDEVVTLGFVGRITLDKGINDLFGAVRILKNAGVPVKLLLVGARETTESINRQLVELSNDVIEVGPVADPETYFELMDIFVLPSRREGFSNAVLEAAAMKVPIIGAHSTGIVDFVKHQDTGLIVDQGKPDQIAEGVMYMLEQPHAVRRLRENAFERVRQMYDRETVHQTYTTYLTGLIKRHISGD